jgi:hypothetical protein
VSAVTLWLGVRAGDAVGVKAIVLVGVGVAIEEGGLAQDVSKARKKSIEMTQVRLTSIKTLPHKEIARVCGFNWHNQRAFTNATNPRATVLTF